MSFHEVLYECNMYSEVNKIAAHGANKELCAKENILFQNLNA